VVNRGLFEQAAAAAADTARSLKRVHPSSVPTSVHGPMDLVVLDDGDFYHQQLRHFLESRGGAGGVGGERTETAMAIAAANRKRRVKKTGVDTKASKGRKIR
jgi:hypothetical protein